LEDLPGAEWTDAARRLAAAFWPGPLTLALPARAGTLPAEVLSPGGTVAVRVSPHEAVRAILGALRQPITSTSANLAGASPAADADAAASVAEAAGARDCVLVVDGGALPPSAPSTLVDCAREPPRVLRVGAVPVAALRTVVPEIDESG
jgi:L-threonylcarbamoyladenylate synthase